MGGRCPSLAIALCALVCASRVTLSIASHGSALPPRDHAIKPALASRDDTDADSLTGQWPIGGFAALPLQLAHQQSVGGIPGRAVDVPHDLPSDSAGAGVVAIALRTDPPSTDGDGPITAARSARQLLQLLANARSVTEPRRLRPATPATSLSPATATLPAALAALRAFAAWFLSPDPDDASSHGCAMAWVPAQQDGLYGA